MKGQLMMGAAVLLAVGTLAAQEVQTFNTAADWDKNPAVSEADGVLTVKNRVMLSSSRKFKVDPTKTYTLKLSARAQNASDNDSSRVLAGFLPYDKNGKMILSLHVNIIPGTLTEVVADAARGDKSLRVKDGSKFQKGYMTIVADAREDLSDLPNYNIVGTQISDVVKKDDGWEIILKNPLLKAVKAGTLIREHIMGGYLYTGGTKEVKSDWVKMSGSIKGMSNRGYFSPGIWPVGTDQAQILILSNWKSKKLDTQYKNVTLSVK